MLIDISLGSSGLYWHSYHRQREEENSVQSAHGELWMAILDIVWCDCQ